MIKLLSIVIGVTLPLAVVGLGAWLIYQARQAFKAPDEIEDESVLADLENAMLEGELAPQELEKARHSLERHKLDSLIEADAKEDRSDGSADIP